MRKRMAAILLLTVLLPAGCRTRTVADPALADTVLGERTAQPAAPEQPVEELPPSEPPREEPTPPEPAEPLPEEPALPSGQPVPSEGTAEAAGPGQAGEAPEPVPQPVREELTGMTVTFDGNGGRVKSRQAKAELDGGVYGILPVPLREGYSFDGWFTAPEGGEQVLEGDAGDGDVILYAHWTYDPLEFWAFTLKNRRQQVYLCQQVSVYYETEQANVTRRSCSLISATGSFNIAENREDTSVTDDWVLAKKPQVVVKRAGSMSGAAAVKSAMAERFPDQEIVVVSSAGLDAGSPSGIYAGLAFAKRFYPDWYSDVDLDTAASELGLTELPIYF